MALENRPPAADVKEADLDKWRRQLSAKDLQAIEAVVVRYRSAPGLEPRGH